MALFSKVLARKAVKARPAGASHCVKDAHTKQILTRGTYDHCARFQSAFGVCYIETL